LWASRIDFLSTFQAEKSTLGTSKIDFFRQAYSDSFIIQILEEAKAREIIMLNDFAAYAKCVGCSLTFAQINGNGSEWMSHYIAAEKMEWMKKHPLTFTRVSAQKAGGAEGARSFLEAAFIFTLAHHLYYLKNAPGRIIKEYRRSFIGGQ